MLHLTFQQYCFQLICPFQFKRYDSAGGELINNKWTNDGSHQPRFAWVFMCIANVARRRFTLWFCVSFANHSQPPVIPLKTYYSFSISQEKARHRNQYSRTIFAHFRSAFNENIFGIWYVFVCKLKSEVGTAHSSRMFALWRATIFRFAKQLEGLSHFYEFRSEEKTDRLAAKRC